MTILETPAPAPTSEAAFQKARDLNERLRGLDTHSPAYLETLVTLITACQGTISSAAEHGEAHVLLANGCYLLHLEIYRTTHSRLALSLAAATIQHWSDQPIRRHLSAANVEAGCRVYDLIAGELSEIEPEYADREEMEMRYMETAMYSKALVTDPRDLIATGPQSQ